MEGWCCVCVHQLLFAICKIDQALLLVLLGLRLITILSLALLGCFIESGSMLESEESSLSNGSNTCRKEDDTQNRPQCYISRTDTLRDTALASLFVSAPPTSATPLSCIYSITMHEEKRERERGAEGEEES